MKNSQRSQRGSVLLLAVWLLFLLSGIALGVAATVGTDMHLTRNLMDQAQARHAAQAAIHRIVLALLERRNSASSDRPPPRSFDIGGTRVTASVTDECAKVDLNTGWGLLVRGLTGWAAGKDRSLDVGQAWLDWRDPDDRRRPGGAEDIDYAGANYPYGARDGVFDTIDELRLVRGMTPEIYRRLAPHVTVDCLNAGVDPLVASRTVLTAVPGIDRGALLEFLAVRDRLSIEAAEAQARGLGNASRYLEISPRSAFGITATATHPSGSRVTWRAVVWITGNAQRPYIFRTWGPVPDLGGD
ncbi:MAG: hypothetical protein V3S44_08030 [Alphaproteobacteria bacterium]